jgi:quinol-cytochrome oxidoreductase complex cytochrome b subunit
MFKEGVVSLGLFLLVLLTTFLFPVPIEAPVDPATTEYAPSAMWFWLFLDQLLLLFPGSWLIPIGAVIAPAIVFLLLVLLPWLDRGPTIRPNQRPASIAFLFVIVAAIFVLGLLAASRVYNYEFISAPVFLED